MNRKASRDVVLWSGGLDSTFRLHELALQAKKKKTEIVALSISDHMGAEKNRFIRQARARKNYMRFARKLGLDIDYQEIQVTGSALMEKSPFGVRPFAVLREWHVFTAWILPFLRSGDSIHFGYEPYKTFKEEPINSLLAVYKDMVDWDDSPKIYVPVVTISHLMKVYKKHRIPRNCISSCETTGSSTKDCGFCPKCNRIIRVMNPDTQIYLL